MTRACEVLGHLEELLTALQQNAWQQREALVALRVGAVEALAAQQQLLLQKLEQYQQRCVPLLEDIQREPQLRR
ncbi:MAG: hypothetical protein NZ949_06080, partial [Candidatus Kapabacteria bacterium]|nr:hypothetical protein [Candidatus Kapabacteria bacterium]MDW7997025.1 hypothetical protein [Bacteroidota bacterium]